MKNGNYMRLINEISELDRKYKIIQKAKKGLAQ